MGGCGRRWVRGDKVKAKAQVLLEGLRVAPAVAGEG